MSVELSPLAEPVQGVLIFKDQIICYREYLLVCIRKTGFEISLDTCEFANLIKQIGRSIEYSLGS